MAVSLKKRSRKDRQTPYLLWGLIAAELFMSFSFLGYIHIKPISITFVYIPVLVAGCMLGPAEGALLGAIFGISSMWKASAFYVSSGDAIFSPAMSGKPLESVLLSVGARALFGLAAGLLYQAARRTRRPLPWIILITTIGKNLHSFFVYAFMGAFFPEMGRTVLSALTGIFQWDFIVFSLVANAIVCLFYLSNRSERVRQLTQRIFTIDQAHRSVMQKRSAVPVILGFVILANLSVAYYFTNRIESMMTWHRISVDETVSYDLTHLQLQFLLGTLSLTALAAILISLYQKNFDFLYYEARRDGLTGLLSRSQFFQMGEGLLRGMKASPDGGAGCFLILDVDEFKKINDRYGHPTGDRIIREVAQKLQDTFGNSGILGRLGGDEFVALLHSPASRAEMEERLQLLRESITRIPLSEGQVTCSIGVIPTEKEYELEELYRSADRLLYEAKKNGKNQFVFGYRYETL